MQIQQREWTAGGGWTAPTGPELTRPADLVLAFGGSAALGNGSALAELRSLYPSARSIGCSTAGEIADTHVRDDGIVASAVCFEKTLVEVRSVGLAGAKGSFDAGRELASLFPHQDLRHLFVLSDGLQVNGSELVKGLAQALPAGVAVTGGLAGDGPRFKRTLVCVDERAGEGAVAGVALYGRALQVGYASLGGWDPFGPERLVTRSEGNVLFELDGRSALELYKKYLGDAAAGLPASGLLFPLSLRGEGGEPGVVRTILGIDEKEQTMTFAGDIPQGAYVRLMKANFERLIEGASGAALATARGHDRAPAELAILISCVGRKLVLQQRIEEEVESVREVLGPRPVLTGFYSYGEISPFAPSARCELHNQTMTITTLAEG